MICSYKGYLNSITYNIFHFLCYLVVFLFWNFREIQLCILSGLTWTFIRQRWINAREITCVSKFQILPNSIVVNWMGQNCSNWDHSMGRLPGKFTSHSDLTLMAIEVVESSFIFIQINKAVCELCI